MYTRTVIGRQRRVTNYARNVHAQTYRRPSVFVLLVPHRGRGACLVSDTPGVGREPLSSSNLPALTSPPLVLPLSASAPSLRPVFFQLCSPPVQRCSFPPRSPPPPLFNSGSATAPCSRSLESARAQLKRVFESVRIQIGITMGECASACVVGMHRCVYRGTGGLQGGKHGKHGIGGTAKVRTHGRATPTGEEEEDEERARDFYRELALARTRSRRMSPRYIYGGTGDTALHAPHRATPYNDRRNRHISNTVG